MSPVLADLLNIRLIINSRSVKRPGASLIYSNIFRLLDIALLKAVALLLVYNLQEEGDYNCDCTEECEY